MFANEYRGRKVFITGHTGFKGSWLAAWLAGLGANVTGFSKSIPTHPSNFEALVLDKRINDLRGDVRDKKALTAALEACQPEIVFHLAAQALVRDSYEYPVQTFETNAMGTLNILEAIRHTPSVKAAVIITSDKCYRNEEWVWGYRETDRLGGSDPYSASKGCAELIAQSYFDCFFGSGPACVTVRAGNVIGGGDWARDRIVPDCARAWRENRPVRIRSPQATRPWQLALEPLSGYLWIGSLLLLGHKNASLCGQAYNFGPPADVNKTVADVVNSLAYFWPGFKSEMDCADHAGKKECGLLKLCCDKALFDLDWKATLNFEETIRYTAEWYACFYAQQQADMWNFSQGQIAAYANAALERGLPWAKN